MTDDKKPNFEHALHALEALVQKMEEGNLSLDDSLKHFEQGIQLTRECQQALTAAEQKIQALMTSGNDEQLEDFDPTGLVTDTP